MQLTAQLALRSKNPGASDDYRVLAQSPGPLEADDFRAVYYQLNAGDLPSAPRRAIERAPWLTFGAYRQGDQPMLVAVRQEWAEHGDSVGRPAVAQLCLAVPYDERLFAAHPDYASIAAAIPPYTRFQPTGSGQLAPLTLSFAAVTERLAATVKRIAASAASFEFYAAAAALLLDHPLAFVEPHDLDLEERIARLDAVTALLPYGARADLTASSWLQSASVHRVRLAFAASASFDQVGLREGKSVQAHLKAGGSGERYYRLLRDLADRRGVPWLVERLANSSTPLSFAEPAAFVAVLERIDWPYPVLRAVREGRAASEDVRRVLRGDEAAALTPPQQAECLKVLLDGFLPEDADLLQRFWQPDLLPALLRGATAALAGRAEGMAALKALVGFAERLDKRVELTGAFLGYTTTVALGEERRAAQAAVATIIAPWLPALLRRDNRLRELLAGGNRPVLYEAVVGLAQVGRPSEVKALCEAIGPGERDLRAFQIAGGLLRQDAEEDTVAAIGDVDARYVRALVELAVSRPERDALPRLLPAVAAWLLAALDTLPDDEKKEWGALLPEIGRVADPPPQLQAQLDMLFLALRPGEPPLYIQCQLTAPEPVSAVYVREIQRIAVFWPDLGRGLVRQFVESTDPRRLAGEAEPANIFAVLARLAPLAKDDAERARLDETVLRIGYALPPLLEHTSFARYWREPLVKAGHGAAIAGIELRSKLDVATPVPQAAALCTQILRTTPGVADALVDVLEEKGYFRDLKGLREFLDQLKRQLREHGPEAAAEGTRAAATLTQAVLKGRLAPALAVDFRQFLIDNTIADLERAAMTIGTVADYLEEPDKVQLRAAIKQIPQGALAAGRRGPRAAKGGLGRFFRRLTWWKR